jgi:uncharacterized protein (DUF849 family)
MKTIITCAVTGGVTRPDQTPYLPITPKQIAESSLEAAQAGAAVIHIHVRDPQTGRPSMDLSLYSEVVDRIKEKNSDVLINLSTGAGATGPANVIFGNPSSAFQPAEKRAEHILALKPDLCSFDLNTMNRGMENITVNSIAVAKEMAALIKSAGVKPELEIFDGGDMRIANMLINEGLVVGKPLWQIATGIPWGWDSTIGTLNYAMNMLPSDSTWYAFGIGTMEMPMVAMSTVSGGHARVGLEDNIYISKGVLAQSNRELVEKAVGIVKILGGDIATPAQARQMLDL